MGQQRLALLRDAASNLEAQGSRGCECWSRSGDQPVCMGLSAGRDSCVSSHGHQEEVPAFSLFLRVRPSTDWVRPTHIKVLFSLHIPMLIPSRNMLKDTPRLMFVQMSGSPWPGQVDTHS